MLGIGGGCDVFLRSGGILAALLARLRAMGEIRRQRATLSDWQLQNIGLGRAEATRPFWQI